MFNHPNRPLDPGHNFVELVAVLGCDKNDFRIRMAEHVRQLYRAGDGVQRHDNAVARHRAEKQARCPVAVVEQERYSGTLAQPESVEILADIVDRVFELREAEFLTALRRDQKVTIGRGIGIPLDAGAHRLHVQSLP